ncbi:MAG: peptidylprolyl isomerase [Marinilabiliales bacterium]|nr:MAG: peptidylprolyl isomerase [Marinilabiliales bacterium]
MLRLKYISVFIILVLIFVSCCKNKNPEIIMKTDYGNIVIELYAKKAPVTVANFLRYIDEKRMQDATFYRTVTMKNQPENDIKIEVIQGGLYEDEHPDMLAPITHETTEFTGIMHKDGVISMARNGPGTATSEFFICIGDQPALDYGGMRNPDGQGFAAFGKVIEGMDVVKKIQQLKAEEQYLNPRVKILEISRKLSRK